jgi:type I restriction enzyme M protein
LAEAFKESDCFRAFSYDTIIPRDKVSLDIFWLKNESLEDTENLPDSDMLAQEIVENREAALMRFESIVDELGEA